MISDYAKEPSLQFVMIGMRTESNLMDIACKESGVHLWPHQPGDGPDRVGGENARQRLIILSCRALWICRRHFHGRPRFSLPLSTVALKGVT
jgi:hypothetical protein